MLQIKYLVLGVTFTLGVMTVSCQSRKSPDADQSADASNRMMSNEPNTLSASEEKNGWVLLFDGKTSAGWRGAYKDDFPVQGWKIEGGELAVIKSDGREARNGGDIITKDKYSNFELVLETKLTPGANSGVKYFVTERLPKSPGSAIGLEFQILDDDLHPDAKMGINGNRTIGSLYDLITAKGKEAKPIGEWNHVRIISKNKHVEHWLNGTKVVEYDRGSPAFRALVANSKYKGYMGFGEAEEGHLLLQDHGDEVHYRNIRIRKL
ncbi:MAG: 3-keto-disaccharide hydrolase [Daejeonella sp.]